MAKFLCLILTLTALLVSSHAYYYNPRFQPAFAPAQSPFPQLQRNLNSYSDFMPSFGPQAPYGSPMFNAMNDLSVIEQQMHDPMSYYQSSFMQPNSVRSPYMYEPFDDLSASFYNNGYKQIPYVKEVIESKKKRSVH
jgi:hypothetical protein